MQATMLKKKKGNNPSSSSGSSGNHTSSGIGSGSSKVRTVIPAAADLDSGGFDEPPAATGCNTKGQIYSTTV